MRSGVHRLSLAAVFSCALVACTTASSVDQPDLVAPDVEQEPDPDLGVPPDLKPPKKTKDLTTDEPDDPAPDLASTDDPLQPTTHIDDVALLDPTRVGLTNCSKMPALLPSEVVDFFPNGLGSWALAADPRASDFAVAQFYAPYRNCNAVTGCEKWTLVQPNFEEKYIFLFTLDADNDVWLQQYAWNGVFVTQRPVTSNHFTMSFAVDGIYTGGFTMRRFVVDLGDKGICIESLVTSRTETNGTFETELYAAFSRDHAFLTARPTPEAVPTPAIGCDGDAATHSELVAWFEPGQTIAALLSEVRQSVERECHALTGCTLWKPQAYQFFDTLRVQGTDIVLHANDPSALGSRDYVLADSAFPSPDVSVVFTPTCARAVGHNSIPGKRNNQIERVTAVRVSKP